MWLKGAAKAPFRYPAQPRLPLSPEDYGIPFLTPRRQTARRGGFPFLPSRGREAKRIIQQGGRAAQRGARGRRVFERRHPQHGDPQIQDRSARQGSRLPRHPPFRHAGRGCRLVLEKAGEPRRRTLLRPQPDGAAGWIFRKEILRPGARPIRHRRLKLRNLLAG